MYRALQSKLLVKQTFVFYSAGMYIKSWKESVMVNKVNVVSFEECFVQGKVL